MHRLLVLALFLLGGRAIGQELAWPSPGEHVAVQLRDARSVRGVVTGETTEHQLALASERRGITSESAFPRSKIAKIEKLSPVELLLNEIPDSPPESALAPITPKAKPRAPVMKVRSLLVRARLANWDNDPEPDGLLVEVTPLDGMGRFAAVGGSIDLELYGERHQQGGFVFDDREPFTLLDRHAKIVRAVDAGPESFVVRFPFRRFHPDRNLEISTYGLVRARFSVPGQGVFEAADDWTVIRDSSRFRDDVQQLTGKRYLKQEQTILQQTPFDVRRVSP
jgi:hypothetical protein